LCSERAAHAAGAAFAFGPATAIAAKGKRTPIQAATLVGRGDVRTPALIPFVGRKADLAPLELIARRTLIERRPVLVSLIAQQEPARLASFQVLERQARRAASFQETLKSLRGRWPSSSGSAQCLLPRGPGASVRC
jgi:hypothetical protein